MVKAIAKRTHRRSLPPGAAAPILGVKSATALSASSADVAVGMSGAISTGTLDGSASNTASQFGSVLVLLTKEQLKVECRKRGQKTTGTKTELLQRLGHKMANKRGISSSTSHTTAAATSQINNGAPDGVGRALSTDSLNPSLRQQRLRDKEERASLLLWLRPLTTVNYFFRELYLLLVIYGQKLFKHKGIVVVIIGVGSTFAISLNVEGPHSELIQPLYKKICWCLYWICLGILSSVGLGTGLHTFLLYLGPHIAQVTMSAYSCGSLDFPDPPYPNKIICPPDSNGSTLSIFAIMSKVRLESMCWGAGTALGELPPYFMARAARLSRMDPDDDDNDAIPTQKKKKDQHTLMERGKMFIEHIVQRVGFFGILACASIPNPLFDLAGITCGHFLIPFWTFFGATLIGKAIIKMHIQKMFVIVAFSDVLISHLMEAMRLIPYAGVRLTAIVKTILDGQRDKLHNPSDTPGSDNEATTANILLSSVFEKFVMAMVAYFIVSIVNSFAQNYHKRLSLPSSAYPAARKAKPVKD